MKIENRDVATETSRGKSLQGGISVMEKVVLKIKLTILEYRRDRNITYD